MDKQKKASLELVLWLLYMVVTGLAVYVWGSGIGWDFANLDALTLFPVLGLVAFSIMWVHYVSGFIRDKWFPGQSTKRSFTLTSYVVLVLILFHPALIIYQLWRQGSGLPPDSFQDYVAPGNIVYVLIGTLGLAAILLFELKRWFGKKDWWQYVAVVSDIGILLIALHSLKLGQHLQSGWFRYLWYFYIVTIMACIGRIYYQKFAKKDGDQN